MNRTLVPYYKGCFLRNTMGTSGCLKGCTDLEIWGWRYWFICGIFL